MLVTDPALRSIEAKAEAGVPLSKEDGLALFASRDLHALGRMARRAKERKSGHKVFYVLNRYINSTNVCYAGCKFCSFAKAEKEAEAVRMPADEVFAKAIETGANFNQIHIVGGHDPRQLSLDYWLPLMRRFKAHLPHVQLSLFTAAEIDYLARRHRLTYAEVLRELREAGLDNINGGGAEVFSPRFRAIVCPNKVDGANWLRLHEEAHRAGIASNATMLYGTVETLEERVDHLIALRESQERSPGYNAFIPLAFHPDGNELNDCGWTTGLDDIADVCGGAADAEQLRSHQGVLDDPRPEGLPDRAAVRRRRHGRDARLDRRGADLPQRWDAFGAVRGRPRIPPVDRGSRLRSDAPQLDIRGVPLGLGAANQREGDDARP